MVEEKIRQIFLKYPDIIYGFTSISYSLYASQYMSALVFAVPYGEQLTIKNYTEEKFEKGIQDAKKVIEEILVQVFVWLPVRLEYKMLKWIWYIRSKRR